MKSKPSLPFDVAQVVQSYLDTENLTLDGITTLWDDSVCLAARLSTIFDLPGSLPRAMDIAHDKAASRRLLEDLGHPGPRSVVVESEQDVVRASQLLTFPAIMKPLYGAASIGVMKVESEKFALDHFKKIQETLEEIYDQGELMGLTFEDAGDAIASSESSLRHVLFEEFIVGPEFDCDVGLLNGEVVYCNLMDDWEFIAPHFIEIGSSSPSSRPNKIQEEVKAYGKKVLSDMGFTTGVFHVEIIWSPRLGPCLVEVNPRMGGGPVRSIHKSVFGVDLVDIVVCSALDLFMVPEIVYSGKTAVSVNLFSQKSGKLSRSVRDCMRHLDGNPDVVSIIAVGECGDRVTGWFDGYPSHFGRVNFMMDKDAASAIEHGKELINIFYEEVLKHTYE
eukprot:GHVH01008252.1.p1 GENE.GHVH01008252.1~~GHVH01008252.1.p1  ORF type:complete len:391 (+),score=43.25 GHVH01008252.1:512-1684(+)